MDENIILSVKDLSLWYGPIQALEGVNMNIPEKQVTALIGPSGCSRPTFLKTLDRMDDLVLGIKITGSIQYREREIYAPNVDITWLRKQIGMVFQKPNPFPMSICDNVVYGPRTHGIRSKNKLDDIAEKSLQGVAVWDEIKDRLKKSALGLFGGQQQWLCIARAPVVEPDILPMDRATSTLDPISTSKIGDLIADLGQSYIIAIVTHGMQRATRVFDRYAFSLLGQLIEFRDTTQLFSVPRDKRAEDYITGRFDQKGGPMRRTFDTEFQEFDHEVIGMATVAGNTIDVVTESLVSDDDAAAKSAVEMTCSMDQMEWDIENRCLRLPLQQQPVARDLRTISAAMEMVADLQRIGDQCTNITGISLLLEEQKQTRTLADIRTMSQKASVIVKRSILACVNQDTGTAQAVIVLGDGVDALSHTIKGELVELIAGNRDEVDQAIDLITIAKYLERIADHAVNIARWATFYATSRIFG